eukprot:Rhum_TRINITY_DN14005_c0_g1::Rhum_TRINITY_DN14005_c0_g1_i1::g.67292::m.67292
MPRRLGEHASASPWLVVAHNDALRRRYLLQPSLLLRLLGANVVPRREDLRQRLVGFAAPGADDSSVAAGASVGAVAVAASCPVHIVVQTREVCRAARNRGDRDVSVHKWHNLSRRYSHRKPSRTRPAARRHVPARRSALHPLVSQRLHRHPRRRVRRQRPHRRRRVRARTAAAALPPLAVRPEHVPVPARERLRRAARPRVLRGREAGAVDELGAVVGDGPQTQRAAVQPPLTRHLPPQGRPVHVLALQAVHAAQLLVQRVAQRQRQLRRLVGDHQLDKVARRHHGCARVGADAAQHVRRPRHPHHAAAATRHRRRSRSAKRLRRRRRRLLHRRHQRQRRLLLRPGWCRLLLLRGSQRRPQLPQLLRGVRLRRRLRCTQLRHLCTQRLFSLGHQALLLLLLPPSACVVQHRAARGRGSSSGQKGPRGRRHRCLVFEKAHGGCAETDATTTTSSSSSPPQLRPFENLPHPRVHSAEAAFGTVCRGGDLLVAARSAAEPSSSTTTTTATAAAELLRL